MPDVDLRFTTLLGRPHHYAYVVDDIDAAIASFARRLGAGPFFRNPPMALKNVTSPHGEAEFEHSSAFASFGDGAIELMEVHRAAPVQAERAFAAPRPRLHHVAWVLSSLEEGIRALENVGFPMYLRAGFGEIDFTYHDARSVLGHDIELHQECGPLRGFWEPIFAAGDDWDGRELVRAPSPPRS